MSKHKKTDTQRYREESTRDVVFLFQVGVWIHTGFPYTTDGEYCHDGEGIILGDSGPDGRNWTRREGAEYLTNEQLEDMETVDGVPCAIKTWETKFVTLTREEGEEHRRDHECRYQHGWRVFGVSSIGAMAEMISARSGSGAGVQDKMRVMQ